MKRSLICLAIVFSSLLSTSIYAGPKYFVWSIGFCSTAEVLPKVIPYHEEMQCFENRLLYEVEHYIKNIKDGSVVWVQADNLARFVKEVIPQMNGKIILFSGGSDATFPKNYPEQEVIIKAINSGKIVHLFMQNCSFQHPRVTQLPIGIDLHTSCYWPNRHGSNISLSSRLQMIQFNYMISTLKPTKDREIKAICDFGLNDSMHGLYDRYKEFGEDRAAIRKQIELMPFATHITKMTPRTQLWAMKGQCAFDISPPGNGIDCHRTWESLALGCIVIVKDSYLNPLFEGLPVVIIKSWDEITEENLKIWHDQYGDAFTNPKYREKLMLDHWLDKAKKIKTNYLLAKKIRKGRWGKSG